MTERRQLLVRHRALDPTAWTALVSLRGTAALARADLWEFEWQGAPDVAERLEAWAGSANWFANPNRDRATWRAAAGDPTEIEAGAALATGGMGATGRGAYLVTIERGASRARAHEEAASRALGTRVAVRRAQVWWLAAESSEAAARAKDSLFANPHAQASRLYGDTLPVPATWDETEGESA